MTSFTLIPGDQLVNNWKTVFKFFNLFKGMANSIIVAVPATLFTAYFSALTAYGLAMYKFKGNKVFRCPHDRNFKRPLPLFPYVYFRSCPLAVSHTAPITSCLSGREFFYVYAVPYDGAFTESAERHF